MAGPVLMTRSSPIADMGPSTTLMPCAKEFRRVSHQGERERDQKWGAVSSSIATRMSARPIPPADLALLSIWMLCLWSIYHEVILPSPRRG